MTSKTFTSGTVIDSAWLNDVNTATYARTVWLDDYGADPTGVADSTAAWIAAKAARGAYTVVRLTPGANYKMTSALTLGGDSLACGVVCDTWARFTFSGVSGSSDCFTVTGLDRSAIVDGLEIYCSTSGRDGFVIENNDGPQIRIRVFNSYRDAFVLQPSSSGSIENGDLDVFIQDAGRHGVRQQTIGTGGSFINEVTWRSLEIRGVSKVTAGGNAMRLTSTASGLATKFSDQSFLKSNVDAQYPGTGPVPSSNVYECDSGIVENWNFGTFGNENTGVGTITAGYHFAVSGTGVWSGLFIQPSITASGWGALGISDSIARVWDLNYSYGYSRLAGPLKTPENPMAAGYLTTTQTNATGSGAAYIMGALTEEYDRGSCLTAATSTFTAPVAGIYKFTVRFQLQGVGTHNTALIQFNVRGGSAFYSAGNLVNPLNNKDTGNGLAMEATITLSLAAGDYLQPQITLAGSTATVGVTSGTGTRFTAEMIG